MKEIYCSIPTEVSIFPVGEKTDIILRKNIEPVIKTEQEEPYVVYECDEVQFRYPGSLTKEEVEADFDTWWNYSPATDSNTIEQQITDMQIALCEVYELLV